MDYLEEKFKKAKRFKAQRGYEKYFLQISQQYPICIFGCGGMGKDICNWLLDAGIKPQCFCDNNEALHGKEILANIPCICFDSLWKQRDNMYVIVGVGDQAANREINQQLKDFKLIMRNPLGFTAYWCQTFDIDGKEFVEGVQYVLDHAADSASEKLFEVLTNYRLQDRVIDYPLDSMDRFYHPDQYIEKDLIDYSKIKSYVDCGAYTGDSLERFISLGTDAEYHCFEMDQSIFEVLKRNAAVYSDKRIHLYPCGVGKQERMVSYIPVDNGSSRIDEKGNRTAWIVPLDSIDFKRKVDFIKMDIEGAEEDAIEGAKKLIKRDHPVLAVSIYHNFSQFANIVKQIKDLEPRYQVYIRHHRCTTQDTVCYAVYQ